MMKGLEHLSNGVRLRELSLCKLEKRRIQRDSLEVFNGDLQERWGATLLTRSVVIAQGVIVSN